MAPQTSSGKILIGTRGSPLALAQANQVRDRLLAAHQDISPDRIAVEVISTAGDRVLDRPLADIGGKGLFTKEIEDDLLSGRIAMAVHSMKDMPTELPPGLVIAAMLPREDPRDAFISLVADEISALPKGAVVGTASLRRRAQLQNRFPNLEVVNFRGNVNTRLRKLAEGEVSATFLALAGLRRLDMADKVTAILPTEDMLPAVAQGAVGIETREDDAATRALLAPLGDRQTELCVNAERALLASLDGSCRTPIAALAEIDQRDGQIDLRARVIFPDGSRLFEDRCRGAVDDGERLGRELGDALRAQAGPDFFAALEAFES